MTTLNDDRVARALDRMYTASAEQFAKLREDGSRRFADLSDASAQERADALSDIYMPVTGEVVEVNEDLRNDPALANKDPMGNGWFFKVLIKDMAEFDVLMDEPAYAKFVKENT